MLRPLLALLLCACAVLPARADLYKLDKQHTEVRFTWNHLGMSRQGGRFLDVDGQIDFDPARPDAARVDATMKVTSISTGIAALDQHLARSKEFFDAGQHPAVTFVSTGVKPTSEKTAEVTGNLTINGITKTVVMEVTWNFLGEHPLSKINATYAGVEAVGFSARTQIFRSDWGITRSIPFVSDELLVTIETEGLKRPPPPRE